MVSIYSTKISMHYAVMTGPAHPAVLAVELVHLVLVVLAPGAHPAARLALAHLLWRGKYFLRTWKYFLKL